MRKAITASSSTVTQGFVVEINSLVSIRCGQAPVTTARLLTVGNSPCVFDDVGSAIRIGGSNFPAVQEAEGIWR